MSEKNEVMQTTTELPVDYTPEPMYGFEESRPEDIIIPRIKVIQALSPERIDGEAVEGDIINSLTKEAVQGQRFVPIKQYYSNICWNPDRNAEIRILCRSLDGRIGQGEDGSLSCAACKKNQFDNTKTGRDSQPQCTSYLNFLGFFEGNPMPVVLSFARTNYNEGKKMLSIARSMRTAAWNYAYTLESKKVTKDKNVWFIIVPKMAGPTDPGTAALGLELFKAYETFVVNADYEDASTSTVEVDSDLAEEI